VVEIEDLLLRFSESLHGSDVVPGEGLLLRERGVSFGRLQQSHPAAAVDCRIAVGEEGHVVLGLPAQPVQPEQRMTWSTVAEQDVIGCRVTQDYCWQFTFSHYYLQ
jgi:hypothetical protein